MNEIPTDWTGCYGGKQQWQTRSWDGELERGVSSVIGGQERPGQGKNQSWGLKGEENGMRGMGRRCFQAYGTAYTEARRWGWACSVWGTDLSFPWTSRIFHIFLWGLYSFPLVIVLVIIFLFSLSWLTISKFLFNVYWLIWLCRVFAVAQEIFTAACGIFRCGPWAWWLCSTWDLSSPTSDRTHVPCTARRILNHWTTREVSAISKSLRARTESKLSMFIFTEPWTVSCTNQILCNDVLNSIWL